MVTCVKDKGFVQLGKGEIRSKYTLHAYMKLQKNFCSSKQSLEYCWCLASAKAQ